MSKRAAESEEGRKTVAKHEQNQNPTQEPVIDDVEMGEFEDPYGDDFESEEEIFEAGDEEDEDEDIEGESERGNGKNSKLSLESIQEDQELVKQPGSQANRPKIYIPSLEGPLGPGEVMEPDSSVYHMLHTVNMKWPCLSFDILPDNLGDERRNYPQTVYLVTGTQAQKAKDNEIIVMKLDSLAKTLVNDEDDEDEDNSDNDEDFDSDPVLETKSLPTQHTTNRIRVTPFAKKTQEYLTASMSESGDVYIWDISRQFQSFDSPGMEIKKQQKRPVHTVQVHGNVEGYAVDWSPLIQTGAVLTGDISGRIHLTSRGQSHWTTDRTPYFAGDHSIEELQWSKTEKTVFASGGSDGFIRIWDTRQKSHEPALSVKVSDSDVNVMSWNAKHAHLLASGHDNGSWGVWDLRNFKPPTSTPVAFFEFHKSPITSVEFHPAEDSIVAVASEDHTVTLWDLAVEADDEEVKTQVKEAEGDLGDIPPQMLFQHWQRDAKEVHWHSQIPGALISTGSEGISVWKTISV